MTKGLHFWGMKRCLSLMRCASIFFSLSFSCIKTMITSWPQNYQDKLQRFHHVKINQNLSVISLLSHRQKERNFCSLWWKFLLIIASFLLSWTHWNTNLSSLQVIHSDYWMNGVQSGLGLSASKQTGPFEIFSLFNSTLSYKWLSESSSNKIFGGPSLFYS